MKRTFKIVVLSVLISLLLVGCSLFRRDSKSKSVAAVDEQTETKTEPMLIGGIENLNSSNVANQVLPDMIQLNVAVVKFFANSTPSKYIFKVSFDGKIIKTDTTTSPIYYYRVEKLGKYKAVAEAVLETGIVSNTTAEVEFEFVDDVGDVSGNATAPNLSKVKNLLSSRLYQMRSFSGVSLQAISSIDTTKFTGKLETAGDVDVFEFKLTQKSEISIIVNIQTTGDVGYKLFTKNGTAQTTLATGNTEGYNVFNFFKSSLNAGTYYWQIESLESENVKGLYSVDVEILTEKVIDRGSVAGAVETLITKAQFDEMFPNKNYYAARQDFSDVPNKRLFSYENLVKAAANFPKFLTEGDAFDRKRELAAFLANTSHETTGGWGGYEEGAKRYKWGFVFPREVGMNSKSLGYRYEGHALYPPAEGKSYHGRGPVQLSWNYNYGYFSEKYLKDKSILLNNPDKLLTDGTLFFASAIWFWMNPEKYMEGQSSYRKPSAHQAMLGDTAVSTAPSLNGADVADGSGVGWSPDSKQRILYGVKPGFGLTINIINGGLESGASNKSHHGPDDRVGFYKRYAKILGLSNDQIVPSKWGYEYSSSDQLESRDQTPFNSQIADYRKVVAVDTLVNKDKQNKQAKEDTVKALDPSKLLKWSADGVDYTVGTKVFYNKKIYECKKAHKSNDSWTPVSATVLWKFVGNSTETIDKKMAERDSIAKEEDIQKQKDDPVEDISGEIGETFKGAKVSFADWKMGRWSIKNNTAEAQWTIWYGTKADKWMVKKNGTTIFTSPDLKKPAISEAQKQNYFVKGVKHGDEVDVVILFKVKDAFQNITRSYTIDLGGAPIKPKTPAGGDGSTGGGVTSANAWSPSGVAYKVGDTVVFEEKVYKCVNPHTSNGAWTPKAAFTLWKFLGENEAVVGGTEVSGDDNEVDTSKNVTEAEGKEASVEGDYPKWDMGSAFMIGDKVFYQGKIFECINPHTSNAAWTPKAAFTLWREIGDATGSGYGKVNINIPNVEVVGFVGTNNKSVTNSSLALMIRQSATNLTYKFRQTGGSWTTLSASDGWFSKSVNLQEGDNRFEIKAEYNEDVNQYKLRTINIAYAPPKEVVNLSVSGVADGVYSSDVKVSIGAIGGVSITSALTKDGNQASSFDGNRLSYTIISEGSYSLVITATKSGKVVDTKSYNFTIKKSSVKKIDEDLRIEGIASTNYTIPKDLLVNFFKLTSSGSYTYSAKLNGTAITPLDRGAYLQYKISGNASNLGYHNLMLEVAGGSAKKSKTFMFKFEEAPVADFSMEGVKNGETYSEDLSAVKIKKITQQSGLTYSAKLNGSTLALTETSQSFNLPTIDFDMNIGLNTLILRVQKSASNYKQKVIQFTMQPAYIDKPVEQPKTGSSKNYNKMVLGYYSNWAQYRSGKAKFTPKEIDYSLFTHVIYAFADVLYDSPSPPYNFKITPFEWNDVKEWTVGQDWTEPQGNMLDVINDAHAAGVKAIACVGGWNFNDPNHNKYVSHGNHQTAWIFTTMVSTKEYRAQFIQSMLDYARTYKFDGIDIDWEYPNLPEHNVDYSGSPSPYDDKANLVLLMKEMREAFDASGVTAFDGSPLSISVAVAANPNKSSAGRDIGYDWPQLIKYLDWVGIMSYDYHGSWDTKTDAHVPMSADHHNSFSTQQTVEQYNAKGVPFNKLVLGIGTYGRGWSNVSEARLGASASGASPAGKYTKAAGFLAYYEIEELLASGGYTKHWDDLTKTPFIYNATEKVLVGYEDVSSVDYKLDYLINQGLGGAMIWAIDLDEFTGNQYPIIKRIKARIMN